MPKSTMPGRWPLLLALAGGVAACDQPPRQWPAMRLPPPVALKMPSAPPAEAVPAAPAPVLIDHSYPTLEACLADSAFAAQACRRGYAEAQQRHAETAPRFAQREGCERRFDRCEQAADAADWTPVQAGFVLGRPSAGHEPVGRPFTLRQSVPPPHESTPTLARASGKIVKPRVASKSAGRPKVAAKARPGSRLAAAKPGRPPSAKAKPPARAPKLAASGRAARKR